MAWLRTLPPSTTQNPKTVTDPSKRFEKPPEWVSAGAIHSEKRSPLWSEKIESRSLK